ncbi:MAG: PilZ domain-containing protein [Candidatus Omnitrophota bacterium]
MSRDRRRFERIDTLVRVKYAMESDEGQVLGYSLSKDFSHGGLGIPTERAIPRGATMDLEITLDQLNQWVIPATVKVAWVKRNFEHWRSRYSLGLEYTEIDPENREQLVHYAKRHRWVKSDFESALEDNKVPVLGRGGEL